MGLLISSRTWGANSRWWCSMWSIAHVLSSSCVWHHTVPSIAAHKRKFISENFHCHGMRIVSSLDAQLALLLIGRSKDAGDGDFKRRGKQTLSAQRSQRIAWADCQICLSGRRMNSLHNDVSVILLRVARDNMIQRRFTFSMVTCKPTKLDWH